MIATTTLGPAFEGAPGRAHGGVVAAIIDETIGYVLPILGVLAYTANVNIDQRLVVTRGDKKRDALRSILRSDDLKNAIIFCNKKVTVRELYASLKRSGFAVGQIQGDMDQSSRIAEFDRFKKDEINILVASDVAARGLDVKGVSHVVNFDVPWQPDDYIHRIGRTGRAGAKGIAYTIATREDGEAIGEHFSNQRVSSHSPSQRDHHARIFSDRFEPGRGEALRRPHDFFDLKFAAVQRIFAGRPL